MLVPSLAIDFSKIKAAPEDWLSQLEQSCCAHNKTLLEPFKKHLSSTSSYASKSELENQLKLIYHRLAGNLNDQLGELSSNERVSMLSKLTEEIGACTPGFHNRVNTVITSMQLPSSLAQLLCKTRQSLVESTAASLTSEVHAANRVTHIANACGLGVKINFECDPFVGALSKSDIVAALKNKFESDYTPFNIPILLCDELRGALGSFGYIGRKDGLSEEDKSYDVGDAKTFAAMIESCLEIPQEERRTEGWYAKYFLTEDAHDEEKDEYKTYIRDVNWPKINKLFLEVLEKQKYFNKKPVPEKLWEHAYYRSAEETLAETRKFFSSATTRETQKDLIQQLKKMRSICPSTYNEIIKNAEVMRQICDLYIIEIRELLMLAQKKEDYSEMLAELRQLKLTSPQIYQELIKRGEITQLVNNVITSLASSSVFSRIKTMITPPSLVFISQAFQLLIDAGSTELESNIQKLGYVITAGKYKPTTRNFNAAISIAKTIYQHRGDFDNKSLKTLLKGFVNEGRCRPDWFLLLEALKKLPQHTWMSFVETAGLTCSNFLKSAIRFVTEKKIDLSQTSDFLDIYDSLEQLRDNDVKDFSIAVIDYAEDSARLSDPELLVILSHINDQNKSDKLIGKIKYGLLASTKESWVKFLEKNKVHNLNIFLNLAKEKESKSLRLALAEVLKKESAGTLIPIVDVDSQVREKDRNMRRHLFLQILSVANTVEAGGSELCEAIRVSFEQKNTVFDNLLSFLSSDYNSYCWVQLLTFAATVPESTQLRHTILERMERESSWNLPFHSEDGRDFYDRDLYLHGFYCKLTDLLCQELDAGDPDKIVSKILMYEFQKKYAAPGYVYMERQIESWLPILIPKLSSGSFVLLLNDVDKDKDIRTKIYAIADKISTPDNPLLAISALRVFLIAKLSAYMNSNGVTPSGSREFFSTPLFPDTKLKLEDAKKLISEIASCPADEIKSKIEASQSMNKEIDSKRKLLIGKSAYEKCLDECHEKVLTLEISPPSPRTPGMSQ